MCSHRAHKARSFKLYGDVGVPYRYSDVHTHTHTRVHMPRKSLYMWALILAHSHSGLQTPCRHLLKEQLLTPAHKSHNCLKHPRAHTDSDTRAVIQAGRHTHSIHTHTHTQHTLRPFPAFSSCNHRLPTPNQFTKDDDDGGCSSDTPFASWANLLACLPQPQDTGTTHHWDMK